MADGDGVRGGIDGNHFVPGADIDVEPFGEDFRRDDQQAFPFGNDAAGVIGQPAVGIRDIGTALKEDDFGGFVEPAQSCGRAGSGGDASEGTGAGESPTTAETSQTEGHNDADAQFAQMMIVHHQGALEMAELAVERASTGEVRALAERIAAAQGPEIELMSGWLETWDEQPPAETEHEGMDHGGMDMDGMDQQEAMATLAELDGVEFDRTFLELMIAHHRGATEMAQTQIDQGTDPGALALARTIQDDQKAEITEMETLLRDL